MILCLALISPSTRCEMWIALKGAPKFEDCEAHPFAQQRLSRRRVPGNEIGGRDVRLPAARVIRKAIRGGRHHDTLSKAIGRSAQDELKPPPAIARGSIEAEDPVARPPRLGDSIQVCGAKVPLEGRGAQRDDVRIRGHRPNHKAPARQNEVGGPCGRRRLRPDPAGRERVAVVALDMRGGLAAAIPESPVSPVRVVEDVTGGRAKAVHKVVAGQIEARAPEPAFWPSTIGLVRIPDDARGADIGNETQTPRHREIESGCVAVNPHSAVLV